ncbi:lipoprotein [Bordetella ansorpii]|uniref:Lipoprotein n=1 Tax=Bordetella ansorpii TaxID=288768 RepID=A0A157SIW0_9BORD|nr:tripartite tricarboxylate transporter substrate binding protein [Bordetella ansorpii]SAI70264.1 lipoprotein [Bordetella ansorpii]
MLSKFFFALALAGVLGSSPAAHAASWPTQSVRLVVPYAPGGIADTIARGVAERMGESLHQTVIVENRPGANGIIAASFVSRTPADGYTLLFASDSINVLNPLLHKNLSYTFKDSFTTIGEVGASPFALVVNAALPVKNVKQFVEYAKERPGKLNYASTGIGGAYHLAGELFADQNGLKLTHIPYKGGSEFVSSLITGETHAVFGALQTFGPQIAAGKLRALAIASDSRLANFPEVPTFAEAGFPNYAAQARFGLIAPHGVSPEIVKKLATALNHALSDPGFRAPFEQQGMAVRTSTSPEAYREATESDAKQWSALIHKLKITLD